MTLFSDPGILCAFLCHPLPPSASLCLPLPSSAILCHPLPSSAFICILCHPLPPSACWPWSVIAVGPSNSFKKPKALFCRSLVQSNRFLRLWFGVQSVRFCTKQLPEGGSGSKPFCGSGFCSGSAGSGSVPGPGPGPGGVRGFPETTFAYSTPISAILPPWEGIKLIPAGDRSQLQVRACEVEA